MAQHSSQDVPARIHTDTTWDGIHVVCVAGTLDTAWNQHCANQLGALLDTRPVAIVMDLRDVDFMGPAGIAMLINAQHQATGLGVPFAIVADKRSVLRSLQVSRVYSTLAPVLDHDRGRHGDTTHLHLIKTERLAASR